ncbi:MAG: ATP-binding protein [Rhodospirillaceae bacterium]|nr:ATP-binding protein [Rhodospirillaceae bacterium]
MGETAAKLRQVFDATAKTRDVYFFDEFDAIGSQRGLTNDMGEIRRVLNSFLQVIEQDHFHSPVVAATNHPDFLDPALRRHAAIRSSHPGANRKTSQGAQAAPRRQLSGRDSPKRQQD